jgi:carboxylate-amine ligase
MVRTVGVEEEFLLLDLPGSRLAGRGEDVVARAAATDPDGQYEHELKRAQAEIGSVPATALATLRDDLRRLRRELARAADRHGARLVASATSPVAARTRTTPDERYRRMEERFGLVARDELTCGMHVHVGVDDPEQGVRVLDRIAGWLPVLLALSTNSPVHQGVDTGYASYRSVLWQQWPTAGPAAGFGDLASYRRTVAALIGSGAALDDGMIYFDARLSARYPTVELRICDVCLEGDDAVTLAGLARAMVETAVAEADIPARSIRPELLRAATWCAARDGVTGHLFDLVGAGEPRRAPAADVIARLLDRLGPALERLGDADRVGAGVATILARGTGAQRQRAAAGQDALIDLLTVPLA